MAKFTRKNMLGNEATQAEKLRRKSIDELKEIVRLSRIRNGNKLTTEDLIVSILKSQRSNVERNYMKHFNMKHYFL